MYQTSTASFFPTTKELSSGIQWFKDHPVLAAVAATAVSVITYLNTLELAEVDVQVNDDDVAAVSATATTTLSNGHRKVTPTRRRGSSGVVNDGKLSAVVSWCDEHGGSLTQVFENDSRVLSSREKRLTDSDSDDEVRDDVAESIQYAFQQHQAILSGERMHKSVTTEQLNTAATVAASVNDSDVDVVQADSPQWGWYVPITPPQDQSQMTERNLQVVAPCLMAQLMGTHKNTMKRTTSGQIP